MPEPRNLTEIAEREAATFKARQAAYFGECAIHLMATCMPMAAVIRWLRTQADNLEEYE